MEKVAYTESKSVIINSVKELKNDVAQIHVNSHIQRDLTQASEGNFKSSCIA